MGDSHTFQSQQHHASARSNEATMRRAHTSGCDARHTSSAITPPWGALSMLPLRMTGRRPRAEQRTRPRTGAAPQEVGRAWKPAPTPLVSLPAHRRGPPGHLDYARLEGDASPPSGQVDQAAAQDLGLWINRLTAAGQLALAVRI